MTSQDNIALNNKENNQKNYNISITNYEKDLNNKIYLLQKQYEIKETEYLNKIQLLNNQLQLMKQTHSILKNKLELKDKAIIEFNNIIKDYQIELLKYKQELDTKTQKNMKYKEKLKIIKSKFSLSNDLFMNSYDKNIYDIKMKELIENINEKNEKMNQMLNKINEFEITKNEFIIKNKNLENENEESNRINKELKSKLDEYQKEINNLNNLNIKNKEIELNYREKNNLLEAKINEIKSYNDNIIKQANENINSICNWIENYLSNNNKDIKTNNDSNINFDKLMKLLQDIRNKHIKEKEILIEKQIQIQYKKEKEYLNNNNYKEKYNELNNEINNLYNKLIKETQENKLFEYKQEEFNNKEFNFNLLEKIINEYIKHMNEFIKEKKNKENLNIMNTILEKKIKNLETNIDLKQMEINSLQEIIERRANINVNISNSQNIDDFLNSTNNSINEIKYNFTK